MKLKIRYENEVQEIDICTEEMWTWLNLSETCEEPLSEVEKNSRIQEVFDREFNRPDYNNWQTYNRHTDYGAIPGKLNGHRGHAVSEEDESDDGGNLELFPDTAAMDALMEKLASEDLKTEIRERMKPDQAEMIIAVYLDGERKQEYAARLGIKLDNLDHKLRRAEKNFKKFFQKRQNWPFP